LEPLWQNLGAARDDQSVTIKQLPHDPPERFGCRGLLRDMSSLLTRDLLPKHVIHEPQINNKGISQAAGSETAKSLLVVLLSATEQGQQLFLSVNRVEKAKKYHLAIQRKWEANCWKKARTGDSNNQPMP